jgi:hypothetical protein
LTSAIEVPTLFGPLLSEFRRRSAFQFACFLEAPESGQEISEEPIDSFDRTDEQVDRTLLDEPEDEVESNSEDGNDSDEFL